MVGILIAILSGMLMSVQGVFNTDVTKQSSLWVANSWVQFTALAVCLADGAFQIEALLPHFGKCNRNMCWWAA